jgi:hypothetical protein
VFVVEADNVKAAVAATPFTIVLAFRPQSMHDMPPVTGLQMRDLPAAVAAGPAVMVADEMSAVEYLRVHAMAEGRSVPVVARETLRGTVSPGRPAPEERLKLTL